MPIFSVTAMRQSICKKYLSSKQIRENKVFNLIWKYIDDATSIKNLNLSWRNNRNCPLCLSPWQLPQIYTRDQLTTRLYDNWDHSVYEVYISQPVTTLEVVVCIQTFYNVTVFCITNRLILSYTKLFRRYQHPVEKYSVNYIQITEDAIDK